MKYKYFPKTKDELKSLLEQRIKAEGNNGFYIKVKGHIYSIKKKYNNNNNEYIVYNDKNIKYEIDNTFERLLIRLNVILADRVMRNRYARSTRTRLNKWNPLTWIILLIVAVVVIFMNGINGFKELGNPFKEVLDSQCFFKKEDIEIFNMEKNMKYIHDTGISSDIVLSLEDELDEQKDTTNASKNYKLLRQYVSQDVLDNFLGWFGQESIERYIVKKKESINEDKLDKLEQEYEESLPSDYYWNEHCDDGEAIHGVCSVCQIEEAFKAGYRKAKKE